MYVSKICLGTAQFGISQGGWGILDEKQSHYLMDMAIDRGINFFDTANVYGSRDGTGQSETIIGNWFSLGANRREKVILNTKIGRDFVQGLDHVDGPNNREGLSLYRIRRHIEDSLRRLKTEKIELYTMHKRDQETTWDEVWEAFEGLIRSGKVDYIGASNHDAWELTKAQEIATKRNFMGLIAEQHFYTPLNRFAELEVFPMAKSYGIGVTVYSPLCRGLLGYDHTNKGEFKTNREIDLHFEHVKDKLVAYSKLCTEIGYKPAQVTLAWELRDSVVNSIIISPNTVEQLEDLLVSLDIVMSKDILEEIDKIFPPVIEFNPYVPHGVRGGHL